MSPGGERLLLVDDDDRLRQRLSQALISRGIEVLVAPDHTTALAHAKAVSLDYAVVDLRMPGPSGLQVVEDLARLRPGIATVVLTGYGSIASAVAAMRLGALDYLTKPCHADQILSALRGGAPDEAAPPISAPSLQRLEREHIERVLLDCKCNVSKAARVLGLHRRTLQYKLAKDPVSR